MKFKLSALKTPTAILIVLVGFYFALQYPKPEQVGYYTCSKNADCTSGNCINGLCRNSTTFCGDGFCDAWEDCSSCQKDCGHCLTINGEPCSDNIECESKLCLHEVCRSGKPYHGDGFCDAGETCWNAPKDCGECRWI